MSIITNTTVVSNFAGIGQLDLLRQLFGTIHISAEVYQEIQAGLQEGYRFYRDFATHVYSHAARGWIRLTGLRDRELAIFGALPAHLHDGEASCIAIAENRGWWFLSDDLAARTLALARGVRLSGSVGCLVMVVERDVIPLAQANDLLQRMIRQGYRSPVSDLAPLVRHR